MNKKWIGFLLFLGIGIGVTAVILAQNSPLQATPVAASERAQVGDREMVIAVSENINGEVTEGTVRVTFEESDLLPDTAADTAGVFVSASDNAVTIGTGTIEVEVGVDVINDEEPVTTVDASYDGPEKTILFTDDTQFYADDTPHPDITAADIEAGELTIQRNVTAGNPADIGDNMLLRIWGHDEDGQFVADIVVYEIIR